jgi:hypothetical protein
VSLLDCVLALEANLKAIDGVQTSPFPLGAPSPPTIQLLPGPVTYDLAMGRGLDTDTVTIQALAPTADLEGATRQMLAFMEATGASSIKEAAESDKTLGGWADDMIVTVCSGVSLAQTRNGIDVLLAEWTTIIYVKGTI